jgi:hypothetical protein
MYNGIEIDHPVFRVLFCNLIVAFLSSAVNVVVYPFETEIKYSTMVTTSNGLSLMFHCCCWLILSLLRFFYIIHKDWLLRRFPDPKTLNRLAVGAVFVIFSTCSSIIVVVCWLCGWPRIKIFEMPMPQKAISVLTSFGIFLLLISFSCPFYLFILRKRGKLRNNKVGNIIPEVKVKDSDLEMRTLHVGDVNIGNPQSNDAFPQEEPRMPSINKGVTFLNKSYKHLFKFSSKKLYTIFLIRGNPLQSLGVI